MCHGSHKVKLPLARAKTPRNKHEGDLFRQSKALSELLSRQARSEAAQVRSVINDDHLLLRSAKTKSLLIVEFTACNHHVIGKMRVDHTRTFASEGLTLRVLFVHRTNKGAVETQLDH